MRRLFVLICLAFMLVPSVASAAQLTLPALAVNNMPSGGQTYSINLQIIAFMTLLSVLPGLLLALTSFTRIMIVLSILRQAIGMAQTPTNQILIGLSLFLTFFVMSPVLTEVNNTAIQPYIQDKVNFSDAMNNAQKPFRQFMLNQTRKNDLALFERFNKTSYKSLDDIPITLIIPAFITSELKTAFEIGFILFLPFLVIDLIVASVLVAMGMMMLSPLIISLPFKIMLFVMVDGWTLVLGSLASSFAMS
ncbi:flagellar type III secretion system pore protein FliP [Legionella sp. W05-934-2]|uniref:flagellar type III secretion system pore protein FliP n=1 Tax=Legionella sp. W05-934-2 TaxID=1198649 RepID=UPI00346220B1